MSDQYGLPPRQPQQPPQYTPPQQPQRGFGYPPPPRRPRRRRHTGLWVFASIEGAILVIVIAAAAAAGHKGTPGAGGSTPPSPGHSASAAARPAAGQTVTYAVTGTRGANVTYGPAGTSLSGHVPMRVTRLLGNPAFYSIDAQLQGGGHVACRILVDGKAISSATATGGYNIASCEITDFGNGWQDANS